MKFSAVAVAVCMGLAAPVTALNGGYMNSIAGGSNAKPFVKPAYKPQTSSSPPVANGSYLEHVAAPAKVYANGTPAPAAPTAASYLEQMGGGSSLGSSSGPKKSYSPYKSQVVQKSGGAANAAPAAASYLQQMGVGSSLGSSPGPKKNYSPYKSNVAQKSGGAGFGSYLDKVAGSAPSSYSAPLVTPAANGNAAPTAASYLQQMGGGSSLGSSPGPKKNYSPYKSNVAKKSGGAGFGSYLDKVAGSAPSSYSAAHVPPVANGAPAAGFASSPGPKKSYSPYKSQVAQKSGGAGLGSYLDKVASSIPAGYGAPPGPEEPSFTIPAAPTAASYLERMGGGKVGGSSGRKTSYAPTQSSWKR
jgi:hypothetical protein